MFPQSSKLDEMQPKNAIKALVLKTFHVEPGQSRHFSHRKLETPKSAMPCHAKLPKSTSRSAALAPSTSTLDPRETSEWRNVTESTICVLRSSAYLGEWSGSEMVSQFQAVRKNATCGDSWIVFGESSQKWERYCE